MLLMTFRNKMLSVTLNKFLIRIEKTLLRWKLDWKRNFRIFWKDRSMMPLSCKTFRTNATILSFKTETWSFSSTGLAANISRWKETRICIWDCTNRSWDRPTKRFKILSKSIRILKKECRRSMIWRWRKLQGRGKPD